MNRAAKNSYQQTVLQMGTVVHFNVITENAKDAAESAMQRALRAFQHVEAVCSRFDTESELRRLIEHVGEPVVVSHTLYQTLKFAIAVADMTNGVFDPTVGRLMNAHGFNQHYLTGDFVADSPQEPGVVGYKDVVLDDETRTVLIKQPLTFDLGAVAKGFAVDLAVREFQKFDGFMIDAGGDVFVGGTNKYDELWNIGIRHPIQNTDILCTLKATDIAVCTSGGYERKSPRTAEMHHLILPATGTSPSNVLSSTVMAPFAMLADAFSTAAFLLGCDGGVQLLEEAHLEGLLVDNRLTVHATRGMKEYMHE